MVYTIVKTFPVTIPAGTPQATPVVVPTVFPPNEVERIEWRFPSGCCGLVGIQIGARSVPVIPADGGQWFVQSGDASGVDLEGMHTTGDWSVIGYNTGAFPHIIQVTFKVHRYQSPPAVPLYLVAGFTEDMQGSG